MPEQTASAFVHVDGIGRVYRTGDKARLALDESNEWSCVEYLGRIGFGQVKLSGRRVELGEIDTVMASVFDVQSAHAVVHKRPDGGAPQLFAFLTPDIANLIPKVRSVVEARLPQHMRPSRYFLGAIVPRSVTGKVDRRAIDLLIAGRLAQDTDVSPIDTPTQEVVDEEMLSMLSKLIAQTLNVEEEAVTPTSNLIDLGIDSLHGVRLLSLARKAHVQGLSIVDILQSTTPISLANVFSSRRGQTELESSIVTRELGLSHGDPLPLILPATPMQAGVLALYLRGGKGSKGYINHSVYKLAPGIDLERFKDSWTSIVRHNPILRSRFVLVDNSAISPFALVTTDDLSVSWTEMRDDSLEDLVQAYLEDIPSHFSLKNLKAFALLKDKEGLDVRFVLSLHHSIFDGASLALMLEELLVRYNGTEAKLRREGFEHSVKDAFTTDVEASTSYWQNQLKDFTPDAFPDLTGLRPSAKHTGHHVSSINSSTTFSQLLTISRTLKSTPLAIIQAAWASILLSYSESESPDIVFGTLASNNVQGLVHRYPPVSVLSGSRGIIYDTTVALQLFGQGTSQTELWIQSDYPAMETEFSVVLEIWPEDDDSLRLRATCSNRVLIPSANYFSTPGDTPFMNVIDGIRHELQSSLNPHPQIFRVPPNTLIHHEFEENARLHPNALALWFKEDLNNPEKDVTYTYSDLDQRANRLAQFLVSSYGNLADQAIPLCMEKCPELYVAILGVLKAGAAWCPVDYEAPELRKRDLFFRAGGPVVLISNRSELSKIRIALPDSLDVLSLDDPRLDDQHNTAPVMQTSSDHLLTLFGPVVLLDHPNVKSSWQGSKMFELFCYTFDVSVLDIFYALGNSCGTLCSSRKEILVARFAEAVNVFKATQAFLTPAFMAQSSLRECETLESLISIGEKLSDTVAGKWCRPETVSLNTYGPAESTVIVTYRRFEPDEATKAQNVGSPIKLLAVFAMKGGRIVPRGAVGELALGGHQNARGYHRQPDMTAKKFIWHPVAGAVYMTGDIVRFLHDGTCEFVGRNDDLVKLGGIRVELSEISTSFKSCHPAVHDVATMQLSRPDRPQRIICTFLAVPDASGEENVFELPMLTMRISSVIVVVKRLPHTASNKVDRKALGEYYCNLDIIDWERRLSEHLGDEDDEGNWSETEIKIQNVVSELTGSSKEWIKKLTPLPALGVDSSSNLLANPINSPQTCSLLSHRGFKISPLVGFLWIQHDFEDTVEQVLPCTPLQEGMLGESVKNPGAYWSHQLFPLNEDTDLERLHAAWNEVSHRDEILRVVFTAAGAYATVDATDFDSDPIFLQIVLSNYRVPFIPEFAQNIAASHAKSQQPRWSLIFFESTEGRSWMMLSMHHALYDAHTMSYLLEDVQRQYYGKAPLPRLQLSSALSSVFFADTPRDSLRVWEDILTPFANRDARGWPTLSDRAESDRFFSATFDIDFSSLMELTTESNTSISQILQAAWSIVSAAYLKTDRVIFGETLSLRLDDYSLQYAIAPLITTKPVVVHINDSITPRIIIEELTRLTKLSSQSRSIGFHHVRRVLRLPVSQSLFPSIFVVYFEEENPSSLGTEGLWLNPLDISRLGVEHPVAVNVHISGIKVVVDVLGNGEKMSTRQVALLASQFHAILIAMVGNLDKPLLSLVSSIDEHYLSIVKEVPVSCPRHPLHWLEKSALARPDAVAVTSYQSAADEIWTYRALEEASNQVAHWIHHNCPQSSTVAFCMPRLHTSVVYQLGIFKSGNTYLPIGDEIPAFRKRLIFRTGQASVVLTTRALALEFSSISTASVISVDDIQHLSEISECPVSKMSLPIPEIACTQSGGGHIFKLDASMIRTSWLEQQGLRPSDLPSMKCVIFPGIPSRAALLKEWSSGEDLTVLRVFGVPGWIGFHLFGITRDLPFSTELSGLFTLGIYNYDSPLNIGKPLGSYIALAVRGDSHTAALRGEIGGRRNAIDILGLRSCKLGIYGRMRADNSVEYIGHINVCQEDTGQNVDLTELSHSIQLISPYSIDVANFVFDHPEGIQTYTVSFVSRSSSGDPLNGTEPTVVVTDLAFTRALLDRCKRSLPVHLLPDFIVPLNFLPFSHLLSGTKHEARLKRVFHSSALAIFNPEGRRSRNVCALTAAGAEIRNILSKATRVPLEAIDADTTTLELGIDSLNAISLSYQFKAAGYFVPPHVILSGPSVTKLSEASRTLVEGSETVSSSWEVDDSLRQVVYEQMKVKISAILPCLPLQEGLVAHTFNSPDPVYVNHFILQLEEADVTRFSHAFDDTLKANDILRTCFIAGERSIVQVVISETPPDIWRHLSSLDDPLSTARRDMADVERDVVRHLNRKPPIRIGLYSSNSNSSYVVCLTMHHAIYDGKSLSMLLSEVRERYLGSFRARRAPISRLLNYIARQSRDAAHAFFTDYLYRISKPILLSMDDNPKSYHQTMNLHVPLSHLERISRSVNISFHSLALAAFGVAVIGVVLSGRSILVDDIDTLLVPIRVRTGEYQLFSDVARRIHAEMTSVLEYQHIPLRLIQRWVGSSEPLFDTLFTFNRTANGDSFSNDLWSMVESKAALDYPVAFAIDADPALDSVIFRAGHTPSFGSVATVKSIMARVAELLTNLNASLEVLTSPERLEPKQKTLLIRDNVAVACEVEKEMITKDISFLYLGIDSIISIQLAQKLRIAGLAVPTFAIMRHPGRLYMVHHSFELDAGVEPERLRYAWETVVASTDILRCSFHICPSGDYPWLAAVHSEAPLRWQEHEVHATSFLRLLAIQIENLEVIPDEEGFKKPPLSLHLINAPDARVLVVTMHHCLYDGLSLPYILDDVAAIYLGLEVTKRPQFADAVPFVLHSSKDVNHFWRNRLSGFVPSPLPKLHPQESSSVNLARQSVELPENALDIIKEMGVTVQTIMLLAWGKTLAALTGSLDVVFGHVVAGRAIELEDALLVSGPLFNISDLSLSNVEGAQAQQAFSMTAEPHSHVPLRIMQSEWRAETMSMEALFDTLFVFQQGKKGSPRTNLWSRFNVSDEASGSQASNYPLNLEVTHVSNKLELHAGCQANVMNSTELEEVLRLLHGTLSDIILRPTVSILNQPPRLRDLREQRRVRSVSVLENIPQILGRAFTDNERILRDAFHSISKISMERIGLETPLYALGLDSVGAIQVAAKCRNRGLHIAVADIFAGGTIAAICNAYESQHASETSSSNVEVVELVSSEGQLYHLGAWLACGGTSYEPVFAYRATVSLNPTRLHKAWKTLRETHSILRTAFAAVSPQDVLQVVMKQTPDDDDDPSWSFVALEGDFDQLVREQARLEYQRPSTLFVPPARARLVRVNDQNALLLVFHHATYDAWSIPLLVRDLCALYDDLESKSTSNFSDLVRHIHQSTDKRTEADFWRNSLKVGSGFETSILPTTSPSSGLKQIFVRAHGVVSSADTLSTRCQSAGVGLQALVLTVWGRICQDLTGSSAPIVGVYHTGRAVSFDSLTELAGPTVNVLPMRIPAASPIWEVARQIQAELGKRTAYEHTLLQDILGYVGLEEGPLFNIFVNLLWHGDKIRTIRQDMLLSSLSIGPPTDYTSHKPFDLRSSVNSMDYSYLPKLGLYIDVVLNSDSQTLSVALRCHEALLDEERLGHLVDLFGKGVVNAFNEVS
ncbi:hypothetical protein BDP27DRAFT_1372891 [Rhodocollybia butyracea]|uniref:Carrier domain-containing protein n=1 Tax=Rhodocollybia butyracea TaxID=206335 RepID=A0A9P5P6P4_9AGAR|nr:hypothetical protein BDP27DRAFT_1372891 [Rhodocollybia butyracea]